MFSRLIYKLETIKEAYVSYLHVVDANRNPCLVVVCFVARFQKVSYDSDYFYPFVDYDFRVTFFVSSRFLTLTSQGNHTSGVSVCMFKIYKEVNDHENIEVNLYRVMSMLKLKINVNLP